MMASSRMPPATSLPAPLRRGAGPGRSIDFGCIAGARIETGAVAAAPPGGRSLRPPRSVSTATPASAPPPKSTSPNASPSPGGPDAPGPSASKRVTIHGPITFEFRAEMLNAFNEPYFTPVLGLTTSYTAPAGAVANNGTAINNATAGTSADSFRLTQLLGDNTSRIVQLVWRVRW